MTDEKNKNPFALITFHEVTQALRRKIGTGGIAPEQLQRAEVALDDPQVDFHPLLRSFIERLDRELDGPQESLEPLRAVVMDIKANGGLFGYRLASELAAVVLEFLETVEVLDTDGLRITQEFQKTLQVIATHKLSGDGGDAGQALAREFYAVCDRYIRRHRTV